MIHEEEIAAAVCTEILSRRVPVSASELARKLHLREEKVQKALEQLCGIGVIVQAGNKYVSAESVQAEALELQPPQSQAVSMATDGPPSRSVVTYEKRQETQYPVDTREFMKNEDAIQKILRVFTNPGESMKPHIIAQQSGLGNSRSAVNRHLYFLAEQGVLSRNGNEWTMVKEATGEEMKVMAAQLAKKPQGKKKDSTSNLGSGADCNCPNRGPGCQHVYLTQNVHIHQYNMQVGDNNIINFGADGPKRSDT